MKSFSELTSASQVNNGDLLAISQGSGGSYASKKTTVKDVTDKANLNLAEEYDSTSSYAVGDYCIYESVLYKCIGTTTGTFDSTKWTSVVVTDEIGSGGGGGTGHTIKDDGGNALTQRSNLQFKGVYSHDDSTNSASVVEVAREMTWAEYQLLSADEKKGLITITDRFTADAMFVNGVFIDTDDLITTVNTDNTGSASYTATEDCYAVVRGYYKDDSTVIEIKIDGVTISASRLKSITTYSTMYVTYIPLKKGQTVTLSGCFVTVDNFIKAYGIQQGSNSPDDVESETFSGKQITIKRIGHLRVLQFTGDTGTTLTNNAETEFLALDTKDIPSGSASIYGLGVLSGTSSNKSVLIRINCSTGKVTAYNYTGTASSYLYGEITYTV